MVCEWCKEKISVLFDASVSTLDDDNKIIDFHKECYEEYKKERRKKKLGY